jgi:flavodoxin
MTPIIQIAFSSIRSNRGGILIKIELYHASKFGNGAKVAEELRRVVETKGHQVNVHHIDDAEPKELPLADLYIFGSPTRFGGPIGSMHRFIKKVTLPLGTKYAIFATHGDAVPNKKTGQMPTEEELNRERKTIPELEEILREKGLVKIADKVFLVSGEKLKGPLKEGWQEKVEEFATAILSAS